MFVVAIVKRVLYSLFSMRAGAISLISSELLGDVEVYSEAIVGATGGGDVGDVGVGVPGLCGPGGCPGSSAGLRGGHCVRAYYGHYTRRTDRYRYSRFVYAEGNVYICSRVVRMA